MDEPEPMEGPITRTLRRLEAGVTGAADELVPLVYDELRALAAARIAQLSPGQTMQATALIHDAWVRLGGREAVRWDDRAHFFGAAAQAMRQILVDEARRKNRDKRGGGRVRETFDPGMPIAVEGGAPDIEALDKSLDRLAKEHPRPHQVVMLRYFAGMTMEDIAATVEVGLRTVERDWQFARSWLARELGE